MDAREEMDGIRNLGARKYVNLDLLKEVCREPNEVTIPNDNRGFPNGKGKVVSRFKIWWMVGNYGLFPV